MAHCKIIILIKVSTKANELGSNGGKDSEESSFTNNLYEMAKKDAKLWVMNADKTMIGVLKWLQQLL